MLFIRYMDQSIQFYFYARINFRIRSFIIHAKRFSCRCFYFFGVRCFNKCKYEYVYLIEMWVNFLCISNCCGGKALREANRMPTLKKQQGKQTFPSHLMFFRLYFVCLCVVWCVFAVNRIVSGLNATWQEQSVAYFKAPQKYAKNKTKQTEKYFVQLLAFVSVLFLPTKNSWKVSNIIFCNIKK